MVNPGDPTSVPPRADNYHVRYTPQPQNHYIRLTNLSAGLPGLSLIEPRGPFTLLSYMASSNHLAGQQINAEFEEAWVDIAGRLDRFLAARGIACETREDVIQETAVRLWERWKRLDRSSPLWNLAVTIAMRLAYDDHRRRRRIHLDPHVDPGPIQGETRALQHAQVREAASTIAQLPSDYRNILLAQIGEAEWPTGNQNRLNVLRFRARRALRQRLGRWAPSAVSLRLRDVWTRLERHLVTSGSCWANGVVVFMVASAIAVSTTGSALIRGVGANDELEGAQLMQRPQLFRQSAFGQPAGTLEGRGNQRKSRGTRQRGRPIGEAWRQVTEEYHDAVREVHRTYGDTVAVYNRTIIEVHRTSRKERQHLHHIRQQVQSRYEGMADSGHRNRKSRTAKSRGN